MKGAIILGIYEFSNEFAKLRVDRGKRSLNLRLSRMKAELCMELPMKTHYDMLGGEAGIRRLVDRFYDLMDELPEAWELRKIHPQDLQSSRDKLFMFLSGWMGGPQLYVQEYGHPRLRARHLPFPVDIQMRDQWLMCMDMALDEQVEDELLKMQLKSSFANTADHMRNRAG